jgi:hypothetical protein
MRVLLNNGAWEDRRRVKAVMQTLNDIFSNRYGMEGFWALDALLRFARNPNAETYRRIQPKQLDLLRAMRLAPGYAPPPPAILNVVASAVRGEGFDMVFQKPEHPIQPPEPEAGVFYIEGEPVGESGEMRLAFDKLLGFLELNPADRAALIERPKFTREQQECIRNGIACDLALAPSLLIVAEEPVVYRVHGFAYVEMQCVLDLTDGMRLTVGFPKERER